MPILKQFTPSLTPDQKRSIVAAYAKYVFLYNEILSISSKTRSESYYKRFEENIINEIISSVKFRFVYDMPDSIINMAIIDALNALSLFHLSDDDFPRRKQVGKTASFYVKEGIQTLPYTSKTIISIENVCDNIILSGHKYYPEPITRIDIFFKNERMFYFKITFADKNQFKKDLSLFCQSMSTR